MSGKTRKVAVIGHFGGPEDFADGQTIKTKILVSELKKATDWQLCPVDTYYKSHNPAKLLWDTARALLSCRDVIVLLSGNGMNFYFPILYRCTKILGTRVYHDVIGGSLGDHIRSNAAFREYLNSFQVNFVETHRMQRELEELGVSNCRVLANFKRLQIQPPKTRVPSEPFRFCTFSRVMAEKGIEDAAEAVRQRNAGRTVCTLDIYGRIDEGYRERFASLQLPEQVRYRGVVPFGDSARVLKDYDALLFPTRWPGEGFAGTLVDAFSAGLPVIASDWNSNGEIVADGVTGIVYPGPRARTLQEAMQLLMDRPEDLPQMSAACVREAAKYQPEACIGSVISAVEREPGENKKQKRG